jgi:hypothetical protein
MEENNHSQPDVMPFLYLGMLAIVGFILFFLALTVATILCGAAIAGAGYLGFRLAHDPALWQLRKAVRVAQDEEEKRIALSLVPEHQQGVVESYYDTRQEDRYKPRTVSVVSDVLDATKQVVSTFRRKEK